MSELMRLRLQFFADKKEEKESGAIITEPIPEVSYVSEGTGAKLDKGAWDIENGTLSDTAYNEKYGFVGSVEEYMDKMGYTPEVDLQNNLSTINYEYQTSLANYGQNAEQLYQMGLQNSGVSDVFQANAFSAYLKAYNDAHANYISTKNQIKREFDDYSTKFNADKQTYFDAQDAGYKAYSKEYDKTLSANAVQGFQAVLAAGLFSGAKSGATGTSADFSEYNKISNYLKNLGYDDATIEAIWGKLSNMDVNDLQNSRVSTAYGSTGGIYNGTGESESNLRNKLSLMNLTPEEIERVIQLHKDDWNASDAGQSKAISDFISQNYDDYNGNDGSINLGSLPENLRDDAIEAIRKQFTSNVNAIINAYGSKYSPDMEKSIRALLKGNYNENEIDAAFGKLRASYEADPTNIYNSLKEKYGDKFSPNYDMDVFIQDFMGVETNKNAKKFDEAKYNAAVRLYNEMKEDFDSNIDAAKEFALSIYDGYMSHNDVRKALINKGYSKAVVAQAAQSIIDSVDGSEEYYQSMAAQKAYDDAYTKVTNGGAIDFTKYQTAADFAKAITDAITGVNEGLETGKSFSADKLAAKAWEDAYEAKVLDGVAYITEYISMGEGNVKAAMKLSGYTDEMIEKSFEKWKETEGYEAFHKQELNDFSQGLYDEYGANFDPKKWEGGKNAFISDVAGDDKEKQKSAGEFWDKMEGEYKTQLQSATARAEAIYTGDTYESGENNVESVISQLMDEGYSESIANAAAETLLDDDANVYANARAKELYEQAIGALGIDYAKLDFRQYSSLDAFKAAIKSQLTGKVDKWLIDRAVENAQTPYNDAYNARVDYAVGYIAENINSYGEEYLRNELKQYLPEDMVEAAWKKFIGGKPGKDWMQTQTDEAVQGYVDDYYGSYTGASDTNWETMLKDVPEDQREKVKQGIIDRWNAEQPQRVQEYVNELYGAYEGYSNTDWDKYLANVPEGDREAVKQAILGQWKSDVGNAETAILNYINKLGLDYKGTEIQKTDIRQKFGLYYNNNVINYVLNSIDNTLGVYKEGYEDSPEGIQETVDGYVTTYGASFDPNYQGGMNAFIQNVMEVETNPKNKGFDQTKYDNAKAAWEEMQKTYDGNVQKVVDVLSQSGMLSDTSDDTLKGLFDQGTLKGQFTEAEIKAGINSWRNTQEYIKEANKEQIELTAEEEISKIDMELKGKQNTNGYLTADDYIAAKGEADALGDSDAGAAKNNEYHKAIMDNVNGYLDGSKSLSEAYQFLGSGRLGGVDEKTWNNMSDDNKKRTILNYYSGKVGKEVTRAELEEMTSMYVAGAVKNIIDTDKSNAKASGLADVGELVTYVNGLSLGSKTEKDLVKNIVDQMQFKITGDQISWSGSVGGAEATIKKNNYVGGMVRNESILEELNRTDVQEGGITSYDGKLYQKRGGGWLVIEQNELQVIGDGHTNTSEQTEGIYKLLVYMLDPNNIGVVKASGDSTSGTFKTDNGSGGRTKDFATENK